MCDKHCLQGDQCSPNQSFRKPEVTELRLSEGETLVVKSGPTEVTICNGEVSIFSKENVCFGIKNSMTMQVNDYSPAMDMMSEIIRQNESHQEATSELSDNVWHAPVSGFGRGSDLTACEPETNSATGEKDIPSS
ncbi:hypothetical protein [Pantoea sp. CCBC3-3-1]|uniref:hypothetical protein n=1 Tax=Pantoea sp. CCBC3-3-1 TaxID=2490851 RepID=UPI0011BE814D|nr:hypothetical protein [Pantoea sp. CCBC3-3-1]